MKKEILVNLFKSQGHIGHQRQYRTPQLKEYIYSTIQNIDIINLDLTVNQIEMAVEFLRKQQKKNILIISERIFIHSNINNNILKLNKWKPGFISNIKYGKLEEIPDIIIVDKVAYNHNLIKESFKAGIIIIGFCDTNTPTSIFNKINYPIVINDDSNSTIEILLNYLI